MKVYIATAGWPGEYDYKVVGVFADRQDAESFALAEQVEEWDVSDGPVSLRLRHTVTWDSDLKSAPTWNVESVAATKDVPDIAETATSFAAWDREPAAEVLERQRVLFAAARDRRAADLVASLDRVDVKVWYEPGDGNAILMTPVHGPKDRFAVPRERITEQAGLPPDAYLHGQWFTVKTCTPTEVDGFSVCPDPNTNALAKG